MSFIYQVILVYLFLACFAYLFSNRVIFQKPSSSYHDSKSIIKLKTRDGKFISAVYLENEMAKYVLLVNHGNATDIGYFMPFLQKFHQEGFSVLAYDYHGYGTSEGWASEKTAYLDVDAAYDFLVNDQGISPDRIITYGQSVGAALAIDIATRRKVAAVIVQSPFLTAFRVMTMVPLFPFDRFNNLKKIEHINCPILVIHGKDDSVIPFWHGRKIYNKAKAPKTHYWVEDAGHNDLFEVAGDRFWEVIREFVSDL